MEKRNGFTLMEMMIVVSIIGILLAMLLPRVNILIDRSREKATHKNLQNIQSAVNSYCIRDTSDIYPATDAKFASILSGYFDNMPVALLKRSVENANENKVEVSADTGGIDRSGAHV